MHARKTVSANREMNSPWTFVPWRYFKDIP